MKRRILLKGVLAASATLAAPAIAQGAPLVLRISSWIPRRGTIPYQIIDPWTELVTEVTQGRVVFEYFDKPLGPPPVHYDLLRSGEADVVYTVHGYSGDRAFPRARIGQFSFLGDSFGASPVFSMVYNDDLDGAAEHEGVEVMGVFEHGPGTMFFRDKDVRSVEDFKGLRIRNSGGYISELLAAMGAEAVPMPPTKVAEALALGEIDGVAFPYEGALVFGAINEIGHALELPGGFYNASFFVGMAQNKWDSISARDQRAIRQVSGILIAELAGKAMDEADYVGKQALLNAGAQIKRADAALMSDLETLAHGFEAKWIAQMNDTGYDGEYALEKMRRLTSQKSL